MKLSYSPFSLHTTPEPFPSRLTSSNSAQAQLPTVNLPVEAKASYTQHDPHLIPVLSCSSPVRVNGCVQPFATPSVYTLLVNMWYSVLVRVPDAGSTTFLPSLSCP